jgi:uncharacterized protein
MSNVVGNSLSAAQNVRVVESFYDAVGQGDVSRVMDLLDDEIEWTEAERFPYYSGTWHGPQAVLNNLLKRLAEDWEGFSAKAHDYIVEGDRVVSQGVYSGTFKKTDKKMSASFAHVWTLRDGRLKSFLMYTDTAKILEAIK